MKRILIVDDSAFMRNMIKNGLVENGFEVVGEAENGMDAIQKYKQLWPDIVTMDITMPRLSGLAAVGMIREIDKDAKIIMVSAMGQESFIKEAINTGAVDFIVKPFNKIKVIETLNKALKFSVCALNG